MLELRRELEETVELHYNVREENCRIKRAVREGW